MTATMATRFQCLSHTLVIAAMFPPTSPRMMAIVIAIGVCSPMSTQVVVVAPAGGIAMATKVANPEIATTSSMDAAATTRVGMFCLTPSPCFLSSNMAPTTTAGETAARMKPSVAPMVKGIPLKIRPAKTATIIASHTPGRKVR